MGARKPQRSRKRRALAVILGDAGQPALAVKSLSRWPTSSFNWATPLSLVVIRHALNHAPGDLNSSSPKPSMPAAKNPEMADFPHRCRLSGRTNQAEDLLALEPNERWARLVGGTLLPAIEESRIPCPCGFFQTCTASFLKTVPNYNTARSAGRSSLKKEPKETP